MLAWYMVSRFRPKSTPQLPIVCYACIVRRIHPCIATGDTKSTEKKMDRTWPETSLRKTMKLVVQKYITMGRNKKKKLKSKANQSLPGILGADEKAKEGRLEEKTERNREKGRTRKKKKR
ncbi:unnamed protein product [Cuscuta europaea]|uniref:Uncharacterized protein n=1 Tax=Cuscuta europaea TaxID=41803 RepID=A0A9P1A0D2_CUSEU|nr:unnamed protein product [Cuscuta europaea]